MPDHIATAQLALPQQTVAELAQALTQADELFHRVSRAIPTEQQILALKPEMLARDAIKLLKQHFYSQAPVASGSKILGVFSFRSFAVKAAGYSLESLHGLKHAPGDLTVEECMEKFDFVSLSDELVRHFDALERDNGVLVGSANNLISILTPMDVLRYLYKVASPFVALSEIELSLRTLIRSAASDPEIRLMAEKVLKRQYGSEAKVPGSLEEMTFESYRLIVASGDTWTTFQKVFGGSRERVSAKLRDAGELRNAVFHFRRVVADEDIQTIVGVRDWLLARVEQLQPKEIKTNG
jgi:predicted transcriptional regulator